MHGYFWPYHEAISKGWAYRIMASFKDKEADFCSTMLAKVVSSLMPKNINLRLVTIFRPSMCLRIWCISAFAFSTNPSTVSSMCLIALPTCISLKLACEINTDAPSLDKEATLTIYPLMVILIFLSRLAGKRTSS